MPFFSTLMLFAVRKDSLILTYTTRNYAQPQIRGARMPDMPLIPHYPAIYPSLRL